MSAGWRPILDGAARERALAAALDVAEAMERPGAVPSDDASLSGGGAGVALLFAYLHGAGLREGGGEIAARYLDAAADAVASSPMDATLYGGFTGIAWAITHLMGRALEPGDEDPAAEIDAALLDLVSRSPWTSDYDLISGLVGFGVYALERLPRPDAAEALREIVRRLEELAEPAGGGLSWRTPPSLLPEAVRVSYPEVHFNLGLAHGVPGVIALLGRICGEGTGDAKARELLEGAVAWLLSQRREGRPSLYAAWAGPGLEPGDCRSAWCYGDPGIAAALLIAARGAGEPSWEREALETALVAARRPPEDAGVVDVALCHGAAGLGLLFDRLYQALGEEALRDAAVLWLERALGFRTPDRGIAGFTSQIFEEGGVRGGARSPSLLTGASGVALALLAAATPVEPEWDRILLISSRSSVQGQAAEQSRLMV